MSSDAGDSFESDEVSPFFRTLRIADFSKVKVFGIRPVKGGEKFWPLCEAPPEADEQYVQHGLLDGSGGTFLLEAWTDQRKLSYVRRRFMGPETWPNLVPALLAEMAEEQARLAPPPPHYDSGPPLAPASPHVLQGGKIAIAPGMDPQEAQAAIDRQRQENREQDFTNRMLDQQQRAHEKGMSALKELASVFKGGGDGGGMNSALVEFYKERNAELRQEKADLTKELKEALQQVQTLTIQLGELKVQLKEAGVDLELQKRELTIDSKEARAAGKGGGDGGNGKPPMMAVAAGMAAEGAARGAAVALVPTIEKWLPKIINTLTPGGGGGGG